METAGILSMAIGDGDDDGNGGGCDGVLDLKFAMDAQKSSHRMKVTEQTTYSLHAGTGKMWMNLRKWTSFASNER